MSDTSKGHSLKNENFWVNIRKNRKEHRNTWDRARFLLADVPLDYREVRRILPCGMRPSDPPMATLFICEYPEVAFPLFPYHEAALLIHVRTPLGAGRHCCWITVDDDTALVLGRELLGYPKKMGIFTFDEKKSVFDASVRRRGITVMSMKAIRGEREPSPKPVFNYRTFHVGGLGQLLALNPIWTFRPREVIHEYYRAEVTLALQESGFDPIARLVAGGAVNGRIVLMDIPGDTPYMLPVGMAGPGWFGRTFNMRFR